MPAHPTYGVRLHRRNLFGSSSENYSIPIPIVSPGAPTGKGCRSIDPRGVRVGASQFQKPTLIPMLSIPHG